MTRTIGALLCGALLWAGEAEAAPATCSFDGATGVLSVTVEDEPATLKVAAGVIQLDGTACGAATTTSTSRVAVTGVGVQGVLNRLTLVGTFAPGRNDVPETDTPEIEIELAGFGNTQDRLDIRGRAAADVWRFTAGGINLNGDSDEDVLAPLPFGVRLLSLGGNDTIDASAYTGEARTTLVGGAGDDLITGSDGNDSIEGGAGNDTLYGRGGPDDIDDGPGNDIVRGGPGDDRLWNQDGLSNGSDDLRGNGGTDLMWYYVRTVGVTVTLDGVADDGEPGENDNVHVDIEDVWGGHGDDTLVGSSVANGFIGGRGNDELHGGAGNDSLSGGSGDESGDDLLFGEGGDDFLHGEVGNDFLAGGAGNDALYGWAGDDILDGGGGTDQYFGGDGNDELFNLDGFAESVDCGDGIDDPESDPLDTFIGCEDI